MGGFMPSLITFTLTVFILACILLGPVKAQIGQPINTPCTASMIATFTPCLNYVTGSSANGSSPTSNCCYAFKSLMSTSMDCACLLVTASVPLPLIVNRTLALGLPRICQGASVPVQCKATGSPLPAPGPLQFGAPPPSSAFSPQASKETATTPAADQPTPTELPPAASPSIVEVQAPSTAPRVRPVLTPSSSSPYMTSLPPVQLILMGIFLVFKV